MSQVMASGSSSSSCNTAGTTSTSANVQENSSNSNNNNSASRAESPMKQIKFYLEKYKIKDALQIFFNESTLRLLAEEPDFMWDVIPLICNRLRGLCQYRFRVFEGCERMLLRLAEDEHCNPKEVLIGLLAEINQTEHKEDDNVFRAMIRPLEGALMRMSMPSPREENFRWALTVLMRHINDTPLPQEYNIEGKKRLSLPNDSSVKRFIETLPLMLSFIEELNEQPSLDYDRTPMPVLTESQIDEVLNGVTREPGQDNHGGGDNANEFDRDDDNDDREEEEEEDDDDGDDDDVDDDDFMGDHTPVRSDITDASITALLRLIQRPFTCLDTTNYCKELRSTAVRCLSTLLRLMPDLMAPIYKQSKTRFYGGLLDQPSSPSIRGDGEEEGEGEEGEESSDIESPSDIILANIKPLATSHFEGSIPDAMLTLATCAYLYRCEVKANPSPMVSPTSSAAAVSTLVGPTMPNTPLAIDMTQYFPQILTHASLFFCHVPYVVVLLKRPEILAHEKGMALLGNLLSLLAINNQGPKLLEVAKSSTLIEQLFHIMIHSPLSTNRRRAYELFTVICDLLTYDCKLELFKLALTQSELRPCIRAACIDQYRRQLSNIHKELMELNQRIAFVKSLSDSDNHESNCSDKQSSTPPEPGKLSNAEQMEIISSLLGRLTYSEDPAQNPYEVGSEDWTRECNREFVTIREKIDTRHQNIWIMCRESMRRIHIWQGRHKILGGHQLTAFLDLCIAACLPAGQHTDIIENNDLILATLTMFRYLKLRKPLVRDDIERDYLASKKLRKRFFNPIRNALASVKTELKTHLAELDEKVRGRLASGTDSAPVRADLRSLQNGRLYHNLADPNIESECIITNSDGISNPPVDGDKKGPQLQEVTDQNVSDDDDEENEDEGEDDEGEDEDEDEDEDADNDGDDGDTHPRSMTGCGVFTGSDRQGADRDCLNFVLCRLDLVESVLVRTCDLYDC